MSLSKSEVRRLIVLLVPAVLAETTHRDHCVLATRVGMDVARHFGLDVKPLPVVATAWNKAAVAFAEEHDFGNGPLPPELVKEFDARGGWIVAHDPVDRGRPGRYPGHLVLLDKEDGGLFDLNLGQMSRPEKGIELPPGAYLEEFDSQRGSSAYRMGESLVTYTKLRRPAVDFHKAPDWKRKNPYAGDVIRRIKEIGS